jgi:SAM-dependent methyltransferase
MYFTRDGMEMASGDAAATHRARRFAPFSRVADLGCGIGADAIALAAAGCAVTAIDQDAVMVGLTRANLAAAGRQGVAVLGDVLTCDLGDFDAAFADPGRRGGGRRVLGVEQCEPPLPALERRMPANFPWAVKLAPGIPRDDLARYGHAEAEFVSVRGELKECVFWFGPLKTAETRATLLPTGDTLTGRAGELCDYGDLGEYVHDPDATVSRGDILAALATAVAGRQYDPGLAMLTADELKPTPFAASYRVLASAPWDAKRVNALLAEQVAGRLTILKRGVNLDADVVRRQLKPRGDREVTLILTRVAERVTAILTERAA